MTRALLLATILAATPVAAQPVTRPDACGATIAYAPDDVRDVVESWLRQEPHCATTLEVRIIPTDGWLYLFARDESGHVRDRVVPDAEAAAVLIGSWMADDTKPPAPAPLPIAAFKRPLPAAAEQVDAPPATTTPRSNRGRWLGVGPMRSERGVGVRAELDAVRRGAWALGVAIARVESEEWVGWTAPAAQPPTGPLSITDTSAVAYLTRVSRLGNWYVRPAIGVGFVHSRSQLPMSDRTDPWNPQDYTIDDEAVLAMAEASLQIGYQLGDNWQLDAGPRVMRMAHHPGSLYRTAERSVFAALRYRL